MSRIIVKNLPKHLTIERFKSHFEKKGQITDGILAHSKAGVFRQFGYIGYKTEDEASAAVKYFNNTYIDTSRIKVELSISIDGKLERPWSKYSEKSSAAQKLLLVDQQPPIIEELPKSSMVKKSNEAIHDPKLSEFLATSTIVSINEKSRKDQVEISTLAPDLEADASLKPILSDLDYFRQKTQIGILEDAAPSIQVNAPIETILSVEEQTPEQQIADTGRLMVRNIAYTTSVSELEVLFQPYGPLSEVHIPIDKTSKQSKGFAFVLYLLPEHALAAYNQIHGSIFQGRLLSIIPAREKPRPKDEDTSNLSYKDKKEAEKRTAAMKTQHTWNSLFMNQDAVVSAMAHKLNVDKSEIMDPTSENMAVRLALSETQILNETKDFLIANGVHLDAFSTPAQRSDTVILVKNIPFETEDNEIESLFARYGTLLRVVIPPTRTVALVEYNEPNEAKGAFKRLAYTRFKFLPLYLEWAPIDAFTTAATKPNGQPLAKEVVTIHDTDEANDADAMPVATLFIKNLNFTTSESGLRDSFEGLSGLINVRIAQKTHKGEKVSMGYGFVEFQSKENAISAFKAMQGHNLDGHALILKYSNASQKTGGSTSLKTVAKGTKLIIRNIPFEATKRDIKQLFTPFAQLKSIRVPSKIDGTHRGFGFVDFVTEAEAIRAYEALSATHLYGRHLVLEWARDDESIEAVREKTKRGFMGDDARPNKKRVVLGADSQAMDSFAE